MCSKAKSKKTRKNLRPADDAKATLFRLCYDVKTVKNIIIETTSL